MAAQRQARACRLGEATLIIAFADEAPGDVAARVGGLSAQRIFTADMSGWHLAAASFAKPVPEGDVLTLSAGGRDTSFSLDHALLAFLQALRLPAKEAAGILHLLAATIGPMFRLQRDTGFVRNLRDCGRRLSTARSTMQVIAVEGYEEAAIRFSGEAGISRNTTLLLFAGDDDPQWLDLKLEASWPVPPNRIGRVRWPSPQERPLGLLALESGRAQWFEVTVETMANVAQLREAYARYAPDVIAALEQGGGALQKALLAAALLEPAKREPAAVPRAGFTFAAEVVEAFADGVFVAGWMHDPDHAFRAAEMLDFSLRDINLAAQWVTYQGLAEVDGEVKPVTGFCCWLKRRRSGGFPVSPAIAVNLASGARVLSRGASTAGAHAQRDAILSAVHLNGLAKGGLERAYRPALQAVMQRIVPQNPVNRIETYGAIPSGCALSAIIPLYGELRFLRSQVFAFAGDPFMRARAEIIYVLDDPRLAGEVERYLSGLSRITGMGLRLAVLSSNLGFGPASNAGAAVASGTDLALMNSDVVPIASGWAASMLERLRGLPGHSVVGPRLLYDDRSLQHAGLYFYRLPGGCYQNMHYYKGYGRDFAPAIAEREVPAVTGALAVMARSSFERVGGLTPDYVIGDYEDSDLCLKLRELGGACHYAPPAELYHFERQSMNTAPDRRRDGASAYNRHLHHLRWEERIAALMERPEFRKGAHEY